jgi:hypothetical protein
MGSPPYKLSPFLHSFCIFGDGENSLDLAIHVHLPDPNQPARPPCPPPTRRQRCPPPRPFSPTQHRAPCAVISTLVLKKKKNHPYCLFSMFTRGNIYISLQFQARSLIAETAFYSRHSCSPDHPHPPPAHPTRHQERGMQRLIN